MSETVLLYHNPNCSKSRAAADYLAQQNVETRIVRYLDTPPDIAVLREIFGKLGLADVRGMMRVKDDLYRELKLDDPSLDNEALLAAIAAHPALLERPIAVLVPPMSMPMLYAFPIMPPIPHTAVLIRIIIHNICLCK